ncbi:hypothetical protein PG2103B_1033 [Bifidobacterium pseudolongum subsp. globosum]|nr:hypothetical protein PG2103B_1033 [Bifidobacterium pseudolongum subsp. globosum]
MDWTTIVSVIGAVVSLGGMCVSWYYYRHW